MERSKPVKRPRKLQVGATQERHRRHRIQAGFSRLYRLLPDFRPEAAVPSKTQLLHNAADYIVQMSSAAPVGRIRELERQVESLKQQLTDWRVPATACSTATESSVAVSKSANITSTANASTNQIAPSNLSANQIAPSSLSANSIVAAAHSTNHVAPCIQATNQIISSVQTANRIAAGVFNVNGAAMPSMLVVLPTAVLPLLPSSSAIPRSFVAIAPRPNVTIGNDNVTDSASLLKPVQNLASTDSFHSDNVQYQSTASPRSLSPILADDPEGIQSVTSCESSGYTCGCESSNSQSFTRSITGSGECRFNNTLSASCHCSSSSLSSGSIPACITVSGGGLGAVTDRVVNGQCSDQANFPSRLACSSSRDLRQSPQRQQHAEIVKKTCTGVSLSTTGSAVSFSSNSPSLHRLHTPLSHSAPRARVPFRWRTSRQLRPQQQRNVPFMKRSSLACTRLTPVERNVISISLSDDAIVPSKAVISDFNGVTCSSGGDTQSASVITCVSSLSSSHKCRQAIADEVKINGLKSPHVSRFNSVSPLNSTSLCSALDTSNLHTDNPGGATANTPDLERSCCSSGVSSRSVSVVPSLSAPSSSIGSAGRFDSVWSTGLASDTFSGRALSLSSRYPVSAVADSASTALITSLVVTSSSSTSWSSSVVTASPHTARSLQKSRTVSAASSLDVTPSTRPSVALGAPSLDVSSSNLSSVAPSNISSVAPSNLSSVASSNIPPVALGAHSLDVAPSNLPSAGIAPGGPSHFPSIGVAYGPPIPFPAVTSAVVGRAAFSTSFVTPTVNPPAVFSNGAAPGIPAVVCSVPCDVVNMVTSLGVGVTTTTTAQSYNDLYTPEDSSSRRDLAPCRNVDRQRLGFNSGSTEEAIVTATSTSPAITRLPTMTTSSTSVSVAMASNRPLNSHQLPARISVSLRPLNGVMSSAPVKHSGSSLALTTGAESIPGSVSRAGTMLAIGGSGTRVASPALSKNGFLIDMLCCKRTPDSSSLTNPSVVGASGIVGTALGASNAKTITTPGTIGGTEALSASRGTGTLETTQTTGSITGTVGSLGIRGASESLGTTAVESPGITGTLGSLGSAVTEATVVCWSNDNAPAVHSGVSLQERLTSSNDCISGSSSVAISLGSLSHHSHRPLSVRATTTTAATSTVKSKTPTILSASICGISTSLSAKTPFSTSRLKSPSRNYSSNVSKSPTRSYVSSGVVSRCSSMSLVNSSTTPLISSSFSLPSSFTTDLPRFQSVPAQSAPLSSASVASDQRLLSNSLESPHILLAYGSTSSSYVSSSTATLCSTILPSFSSLSSRSVSSSHHNNNQRYITPVSNSSYYTNELSTDVASLLACSNRVTSAPLLIGSNNVTSAPSLSSANISASSHANVLCSSTRSLCQPLSSTSTRSHYPSSRHTIQQQQQQRQHQSVLRGGGTIASLPECQYSRSVPVQSTLPSSVTSHIKSAQYTQVQPQQQQQQQQQHRRSQRHLAEQTAVVCEKTAASRQRNQTDRHSMSSVQSIGPPYIHNYKRSSCHQLPLGNYPAVSDERRGTSSALPSVAGGGGGDLLAPTSFYPCSAQLSNQAFYTGRVTHPCYEPQYQPDTYHLQNYPHHHNHPPHHHHQSDYWSSSIGHTDQSVQHHHLQHQYHHQQQQQQQNTSPSSSYPAMVGLASVDQASVVSAPPLTVAHSFPTNGVFTQEVRSLSLPPTCDVLVPFEPHGTVRTSLDYFSISNFNNISIATAGNVATNPTSSVCALTSAQSLVSVSTVAAAPGLCSIDAPPPLPSHSSGKHYSGSRRSSRHLSNGTSSKSQQRGTTGNTLASSDSVSGSTATSLSSFSVHQLVMGAAVDTSPPPAITPSYGVPLRSGTNRRTADKRSATGSDTGRRQVCQSSVATTSDALPTKRSRVCHGYSTEALLSTPSATVANTETSGGHTSSCGTEETSALALAVGDLTSDDLGSLVPMLPPLPLSSSSSSALSSAYAPLETGRATSAEAVRCRERAPQPPLSPIFSSPLKLGASPSLSCGPDRRLDDLLSVTGLFDCQSLLPPAPRPSSDSPTPPVAAIDDAVSLLTPLFSRPSLAAPPPSLSAPQSAANSMSECSQQLGSTDNCWNATPVFTQLNSANIGGSTGGGGSAHSFNLSCLLPEISDSRQSSDSTLSSHFRIDSNNNQPTNQTLPPTVTSC